MKSFRDQLGDLKAALRESQSGKGRNLDKPNIGFEPPASWLATDSTPPKKADGPKTNLDATPVALSTGVGSVQRSTTPGRDRSSVGQSSPQSSNATSTPFRPNIDGGCPLTMPAWAEVGRALQHPEHLGGGGPPMVVRMGLDFGTAFTKVAIRAGVDLVPVDWSAVTGWDTGMDRYVVPGVVARRPDGGYLWQRLGQANVQGNLKLPVIERATANECPVATVAYLALVIRYARAFLYSQTEIGRKLVGRSLCWELNIGCPTKPHEDPKIVQAFQRIARIAWQVAAWESLHESAILSAWNARQTDIGLETEPGVEPEFVAQIAGYLSSPQASDGLHALVDIGAATLDVATFNVVKTNDRASLPCIPIFFSAVQPLGTHYLRHNRHAHLGLELSWNDASPVETADAFGAHIGKPSSEIAAADQQFMDRVVRCITHVIDATRTNARGDSTSSAWREGLPIFVTGGGAKCSAYRRAIEEAQRRLILQVGQRPGGAGHFRLIELSPVSASAQDTETDGRLTVAFGLTEDAESIGRVVPHRDIEPLTRETRERADQTELYGD